MILKHSKSYDLSQHLQTAFTKFQDSSSFNLILNGSKCWAYY